MDNKKNFKDVVLEEVNKKYNENYTRAILPICKHCNFILPNGSTNDECAPGMCFIPEEE